MAVHYYNSLKESGYDELSFKMIYNVFFNLGFSMLNRIKLNKIKSYINNHVDLVPRIYIVIFLAVFLTLLSFSTRLINSDYLFGWNDRNYSDAPVVISMLHDTYHNLRTSLFSQRWEYPKLSVYYPYKYSLFTDDVTIANGIIWSIFFYITKKSHLSFYLLQIYFTIMNFLVFYWFLRRIKIPFIPSIVGASIFAFSLPMSLTMSDWCHANHLYLILLLLVLLEKILDKGLTLKYSILFPMLFQCIFFTGIQNAHIAVIMSGIFLIVNFMKIRKFIMMPSNYYYISVVIFLLIPVFVYMHEYYEGKQFLMMADQDVAHKITRAKWPIFFITNMNHRFWGFLNNYANGLAPGYFMGFFTYFLFIYSFLGRKIIWYLKMVVVLLLLSGFFVLSIRPILGILYLLFTFITLYIICRIYKVKSFEIPLDNVYAKTFFLSFIVSICISFGPIIEIPGLVQIGFTPYDILEPITPFLSTFRSISRYLLMTIFGFSFFAVIGAFRMEEDIIGIKRGSLKKGLLILLVLISFIYAIPHKFNFKNPESTILSSKVYKYLEREQDKYPIAELPLPLELDKQRYYAAMIHGHPMFNGPTSYSPKYLQEVKQVINDFPSRNAIKTIKMFQIKYVLTLSPVKTTKEIKLIAMDPRGHYLYKIL